MTAGGLAGLVSTLGYKILGAKLYQRLGIHDTCGVNNLHGLPGLLAGLLSVVMVLMASEESYGTEMYSMFPWCDPAKGLLARTISYQALLQLAALAITIALAILLGLLVGGIMNVAKVCDGLPHQQLFDDELYWQLPDTDCAGFRVDQTTGVNMRRRSRARSSSVGIEKDKHFSAIAEIVVKETMEPDHLQAPNTYLP